jgi:hypothetical protein
MATRRRTIAFLVSLSVVSAALTVGARSAWDRWGRRDPVVEYERSIDLGERNWGETAVGRFTVRNRGRADLTVEQLQTSCSCAGVERESDGKFYRLESARIPPGGQLDLVIRVAVGARLGTSQFVYVFFKTNDPTQPVGNLEACVSRVRGGAYPEPAAVVFGTLPLGRPACQVIDLYDGGVPGRRIDTVRSLHPARFTVRLLPIPSEEPAKTHEAGGG